MASSAKDIQNRELKDTISKLNQMISEQTELIRSLRQDIETRAEHEKVLQEQVDYLTKKLFGSSSEKKVLDIRLLRAALKPDANNRVDFEDVVRLFANY